MPASPSASKPFSFKPGSGSAPSSPLARSSPSGKKLGLGRAGLEEAPVDGSEALLGRHEENSFHRQLRTLLLDHRKARSAWEATVTYDGLKAVGSWSRADEDVSHLYASLKPREKGATARADEDSLAYLPTRLAKQHQLALALQDREQALSSLQEARREILVHTSKLTKLQETLEALLIEASNSRGLEFAFEEPMWGTWTLENFADSISKLTSQYVLSAAHIEILLHDTVAPSASSNSLPPESELEKMSPREREQLSQRRRERLTEAWALLPFLEKNGPDSERWFEDVCAVEVGRWDA